MSLIDRYVYEVGRRLPRKNRSDIQAELRSSCCRVVERVWSPESRGGFLLS